MNLGCGPDVKPGWYNVDAVYSDLVQTKGVQVWDARGGRHWDYEDFDFVLINHVLCTMLPEDVDKVLKNCYEMLKPGGVLQVIDMNMLLAYEDYYKYNAAHIPIQGDDPDFKLAMHVSGYGTRLSLFTPARMVSLLKQAGFTKYRILEDSEYDTRKEESLIVEGIK
jgi:predicted SAM-dependent methyltransferase